jgi:hypothetical protein
VFVKTLAGRSHRQRVLLFDHSVREVLFRTEVEVQRSLGHSSMGDHVAEAGAVSIPIKHLGRAPQKLLPCYRCTSLLNHMMSPRRNNVTGARYQSRKGHHP